MSRQSTGRGLCIGIGGSNARVALCENGQIDNFTIEPTPTKPTAFFKFMADEIVQGVAQGASWVVVGVPGIVTRKGNMQIVGPLPNVNGFADKAHTLQEELAAADPDLGKLLKDGLTVVAVNDGLLAAFAAAERFGDLDGKRYDSLAYVIVGTGVGAAIVRRKKNGDFRPSESPLEMGHLPIGDNPEHTIETTISGPHLHRRHNTKAEELESNHEAWEEVGHYMGQMAMTLGIMGGAELVVVGGGVGSYAYPHYFPYLEAYLEKFRNSSNAVQRMGVPKVIAVPPEETQTFEMCGAEGVIRHLRA